MDAFAAAEWLARRSDVDAGRMGLLGWSNGGTSVLSAARDIRKPRGVEFKTAIAFYPGCRVMAEQGFRPRIPVTILHGLADDWTPAAPCQSLNGVTFVGYPEAHHDFDHPTCRCARGRRRFQPMVRASSPWLPTLPHAQRQPPRAGDFPCHVRRRRQHTVPTQKGPVAPALSMMMARRSLRRLLDRLRRGPAQDRIARRPGFVQAPTRGMERGIGKTLGFTPLGP